MMRREESREKSQHQRATLDLVTFILIEEDVFNLKMVGAKTLIAGLLGGEAVLEVREENSSLSLSFWIFETLQH
ncbi:hypothetical protein ACFX13_035063 [Malus domestica]